MNAKKSCTALHGFYTVLCIPTVRDLLLSGNIGIQTMVVMESISHKILDFVLCPMFVFRGNRFVSQINITGVGSRTRDRAERGPGRVTKVANHHGLNHTIHKVQSHVKLLSSLLERF
jgi:hypothetical protein